MLLSIYIDIDLVSRTTKHFIITSLFKAYEILNTSLFIHNVKDI